MTTQTPRSRTEDIARSWSKRATVTMSMAHRLDFTPEDGLPDYPIDLLPFAGHPAFERLPEEVRAQVLSYAWLAYNQRTIAAEVNVANPAFELIFGDVFPSCDDPFLQARDPRLVRRPFLARFDPNAAWVSDLVAPDGTPIEAAVHSASFMPMCDGSNLSFR